MRIKISLVIIASILLSTDVICLAGPIGPIEPLGPKKVVVSGYYNLISDVDLKDKGGSTGSQIKSSNQEFAEVAMGLNDTTNAYVRLGAADLEEKLGWTNGRNQIMKFNSGPFWGIGVNSLYDRSSS